jgi:two-component system chemotaxis response regulator CheB
MIIRDIVVLGASAGGVETLSELVGKLPKDFPAAVFVVMHLSPFSPSSLPQILSNSGPLPAFHPKDGETIRPGRIYVALPDRHLLVEKNKVRVANGPKENRFRPSVDALFRSVAYACGSRVIGAVLTGSLDDGTSGLWAIKRRGGIAIIQDPGEATFSSMPANVLKQVKVDYTVRIAAMGELLCRLVAKPVGKTPKLGKSELRRMELEVRIASRDNAFEQGIMELGKLSPFTCPECNGALVHLAEGNIIRFRCHTGHSFTPSALLAGATEANEALLWQAMRGMEEVTMLLEQIGKHFADKGEARVAQLFIRKAQKNRVRAQVIHDSVMTEQRLSEDLRHGEGD